MKKRELLAAGIVRDFRFRDDATYQEYLEDLAYQSTEYEVLQREPSKNGTVLARIVTQYNNTDLINLEA